MRLQSKIILVLLSLGLLPLLAVMGISYEQAKEEIMHEVQTKMLSIQALKKDLIRDFFYRLEKNLSILNASEETHALYNALVKFHHQQKVGPEDPYPAEHEDFKTICQQHGELIQSLTQQYHYDDIKMICAKHGHIMYSAKSSPELGQNLSHGPLKNSGLAKLWQRVANSGKPSFQDFEVFAGTGKAAAFYGIPLRDKNHNIQGVMVVQVPIRELNHIMHKREGMGETGFSTLVGPDGLRRNDHEKDSELKVALAFAQPEEHRIQLESYQQALNGETGTLKEILPDGHQVLSSYTHLDFLNQRWTILIHIHIEEATKEARHLLFIMVIVAVISALVIIVFSIVLGRSFTKAIVPMCEAMNRLAQGDLSQHCPVNRKDELGDLARGINATTEQLNEIVENIKGDTATLASSSEEFTQVSQNMLEQANGVVTSSSTVSSTTEELSVNISTMASAAEEMSVNASTVASASEQMSVNMNSVTEAIVELGKSIESIANEASEAEKIANDVNASSEQASQTMSQLGTAASEIGNVTETIKTIAEQTNLLALNATIEAASAGDSGKGFAVVAKEIKELAGKSASAADDITQRINDVQDISSNTVTVIQEVLSIITKLEASVDSIVQQVNAQEKTAVQITSNVNEADQGVKNVAMSIGEVASGANDVSQNAGEASQGSIDIARNTAEILQAAQQNQAEAQQAHQSSKELAELGEHLLSLVSRFKTKK